MTSPRKSHTGAETEYRPGSASSATIAYPLISAGMYGWPLDDAIAQALTVLRTAQPANLRTARLVLHGRAAYDAAVRVSSVR